MRHCARRPECPDKKPDSVRQCLPATNRSRGATRCAGWLAIAGTYHLGIRLAVALGRLPASVLQAGEDWPDLFGSYDEMAERNGVKSADVL